MTVFFSQNYKTMQTYESFPDFPEVNISTTLIYIKHIEVMGILQGHGDLTRTWGIGDLQGHGDLTRTWGSYTDMGITVNRYYMRNAFTCIENYFFLLPRRIITPIIIILF